MDPLRAGAWIHAPPRGDFVMTGVSMLMFHTALVMAVKAFVGTDGGSRQIPRVGSHGTCRLGETL